MSAEKAKKYTTKPVWVAASILTSDPYQERNPTMFDINTVTRNAAKQAYETAAIGPEDLDMVELHDCFATAELLHYENLGLCGDGEAGKLIDDKETYNGGKIPVNVSGGLLSKGHPLGATGVANITEIVWHLREEAGDRQVKGAKTGLAHVIGLGSACTINVLKR
jgi:acetyl-CoA acetyltransferase